MTPYLLKIIKVFSYLYFLRSLNEKEKVPTPKLEDDVQGDTVQNRNPDAGSDNVESEVLQTEKVRH